MHFRMLCPRLYKLYERGKYIGGRKEKWVNMGHYVEMNLYKHY